MTCVRIFENGFSVKGHSTVNSEDFQGKLVCSAVSSVVYFVANTITEVIGANTDLEEKDGEFYLLVKTPTDKTKMVLDGFKLHMLGLEEQYKNRIKVYVEV